MLDLTRIRDQFDYSVWIAQNRVERIHGSLAQRATMQAANEMATEYTLALLKLTESVRLEANGFYTDIPFEN